MNFRRQVINLCGNVKHSFCKITTAQGLALQSRQSSEEKEKKQSLQDCFAGEILRFKPLRQSTNLANKRVFTMRPAVCVVSCF